MAIAPGNYFSPLLLYTNDATGHDINQKTGQKQSQKRLDEIALSLPQKAFQAVTLKQD